MNTNKITREHISALADGELADAQLDAALKGLRQSDQKEVWEVYHQIGDVLRSNEMAKPLSTDFAARMAARLEAEPPLLVPVASRPQEVVSAPPLTAWYRRMLVPGVAGVAAAVLAVLMAPQLLMNEEAGSPDAVAMVPAPVIVPQGAVIPAASQEPAVVPATAQQQAPVIKEEDMVRDPRIDQYLMAHQRFSPSVYSTAQFARSAIFAAESDK